MPSLSRDRGKNFPSIFSLISFLSTKLYAYYENEKINKFCFLCHFGGDPLLRGHIVIKIQNLKLYFVFYLYTKFCCNQTTYKQTFSFISIEDIYFYKNSYNFINFWEHSFFRFLYLNFI